MGDYSRLVATREHGLSIFHCSSTICILRIEFYRLEVTPFRDHFSLLYKVLRMVRYFEKQQMTEPLLQRLQ